MRSKRLLKVIFSIVIVIALSATMLSVILLRLKNTNDEKSIDNTVTEKEELPIETEPVEATATTHNNNETTTHSNSKLSEEQWDWLEKTAKQIGAQQAAQGLGSPNASQQIQQDYIDSQLHRGNYAGNSGLEFSSYNPVGSIPKYKINYILGHYKELDGERVEIEGYYSYDNYIFEYEHQVQDDPAIDVDDSVAKAYIHSSYVLGANKTGIKMESNKIDINPAACSTGDKIKISGICHTQETNDGTLGYVIIELESLEIKESSK